MYIIGLVALPFGFNIPMTDPMSVFHNSACDRPNKNIVTVFIPGFKSLIFHILKVVPTKYCIIINQNK